MGTAASSLDESSSPVSSGAGDEGHVSDEGGVLLAAFQPLSPPVALSGAGGSSGQGSRSSALADMMALDLQAATPSGQISKARGSTDGHPSLMPSFDSDFWKVYGNKLRVFGTREELCDLNVEFG